MQHRTTPLHIICLGLAFICLAVGEPGGPDTADRVFEYLLEKADTRFRPGTFGAPLKVICDLYIRSLGPVDETNMEFHVDVSLRQRWENHELAFYKLSDKYIVIPDEHVDKFWVPDTFFPNLRSGTVHEVTETNRLMRIHPNGSTLLSVRMSLKLSCKMDLAYFPFDHQQCPLQISSYGYTTDEMNMTWNSKLPIPIDNLRSLEIPRFSLQAITWDEGCQAEYSTGEYPILVMVFHMARESGYFVLQTYISSWLVVCVAWLSFFVSRKAVPARITLGVTTVLSMATLLINANNDVGRVSYARAIDVWFTVCMTMVFLALMEYVVVNSMQRWMSNRGLEAKGYCKGRISPAKVDFFARIAFPTCFVVFNVVYWAVYRQPHYVKANLGNHTGIHKFY